MIQYYIKEQKDMKEYKPYIDDGYTGTDLERPGFKEMLNDWKIKYLNVNYNNNNHINKKEQNIINNNNNVIINNITENISNKNKTQTTVSKLNIFYIYIFKYSLTILEIHFLKKQMIL